MIRRKEGENDWVRMVATIKMKDIEVMGQLTPTWRLDESTRRKLESKGFIE